MSPEAQAIAEAIADVITEEKPSTGAPASEVPPMDEMDELDEYGRTASERTIELESADAEAVNTEVDNGKHKTFNDAHHYIFSRGLAEIKRTREAARQLAEKTLLKAKRDNWSKLLQSNPKLIENADLLKTMLAELGIQPK